MKEPLFTLYYLTTPVHHYDKACKGIDTSNQMQYAHLVLTKEEFKQMVQQSKSRERFCCVDTDFKVVRDPKDYHARWLTQPGDIK